ncbi:MULTISPECIES: hypothetical protein [unclassified Bradyrhizobium]|uniref:hypothetical protein n=1 Tax=unclassified Bradyrhizobium TaxID=2631580 RepID=UPI0028E4B7DA|nr:MULTISPECIES: hypothetical protein [unclassified Bradyrhizobium]
MAGIYGLFSGRDGKVRYVGQTAGTCADRFKQHVKRPSDCLYRWFHNEWKDGYPIEYVRLEICDGFSDDLRRSRERRWMATFPGLLNDRISAQTWLSGMCSKPEKLPEIAAYMRRYHFNAGGYRGIHYDKHWDCYRVLLYDGFEAAWLYGDSCDEMMPGWGGNMWFPDRTAALIARDQARQSKWRGLKWSPDIELPADI